MDIVLVTMPWDVLRTPSLAIGILQRLLRDQGFSVTSRSLKLRWMDFLMRHQRPDVPRITLGDYDEVANTEGGLGDWVFAEPPMAADNNVERYTAFVRRQNDEAIVAKLLEMRRLAPQFLDECAAELMAACPRIVGFTTTFSQNMASLALARRIKESDPGLCIAFGGANCEGAMGAALHRSYPWIDVVVRGEGELVVPPLFRAILDGEPIPRLPGLCYRDGGAPVVIPNEHASPVEMDSVPAPDYADYFNELSRYRFNNALRSIGFLSYETARGCWWGAVSHCTFCGLNGSTMKYRSKSPRRALEDIVGLARTYRMLNLHAVDNILDHDYLTTLLPEIARSGVDLELGYEVKANLRKRQLEIMHRAGVRIIQPGIESLSTPILKLMRKGVTAWQNVRLLKWCAQLGIRVDWNLIYGFPEEPEAEYARMEGLFPALSHLQPPHPTLLALHRYSPYFDRAAEHGLEITGPRWYYPLLYDLDPRSLADVAYEFEFRYHDGRVPERYAAGCVAGIERWTALHEDGAKLSYRRGPGFVEIRDRRGGANAEQFAELTLVGPEAEVYLACDDGARLGTICERTKLEERVVRSILEELASERLLFTEGDRYLGLALPSAPYQQAYAAEEEEEPAASGDADLVTLVHGGVSRRASSPP